MSGFAISLAQGDIGTYEDYDGPVWRGFLEKGALKTVVISDDDIAAFEWDAQKIRLTDAAATRLRREYGEDLGRLAAPERGAFIATLNGRRLFAGRFADAASPAPAPFPVVYVAVEENVVFYLRPEHDRRTDPPLAKRERIQPAGLKTYLAGAGKLSGGTR